MSFVDVLRTARTSAATVYQQFLIDNPKWFNHVFAFLEGHDDPSFYFRPLTEYLPNPKTLHFYKCGNKREVYATYEKISRRGDVQNITLFFVDKDLSDILMETYPESQNIYVTDYYSIENYVVEEYIVSASIIETFHLQYNSVNLDPNSLVSIFLRERVKFYEIMRPLMAWIIYCRRNGYQPQLDNIDLNRIFTWSNNVEIFQSPNMVNLYQHLEECCQIEIGTTDDNSVSLIEKEISLLEAKTYIRGKFELWFLVKFLDKLILALGRTEKLKVRTRISETTALSILGPRARVPLSLYNFIERNLGFLL